MVQGHKGMTYYVMYVNLVSIGLLARSLSEGRGNTPAKANISESKLLLILLTCPADSALCSHLAFQEPKTAVQKVPSLFTFTSNTSLARDSP